MDGEDAKQWELATQKEYDSIMNNETWNLIPRPKGAKVVKSHWVLRTKDNGLYKACFCAKGEKIMMKLLPLSQSPLPFEPSSPSLLAIRRPKFSRWTSKQHFYAATLTKPSMLNNQRDSSYLARRIMSAF
jgi:hypothetical protein